MLLNCLWFKYWVKLALAPVCPRGRNPKEKKEKKKKKKDGPLFPFLFFPKGASLFTPPEHNHDWEREMQGLPVIINVKTIYLSIKLANRNKQSPKKLALIEKLTQSYTEVVYNTSITKLSSFVFFSSKKVPFYFSHSYLVTYDRCHAAIARERVRKTKRWAGRVRGRYTQHFHTLHVVWVQDNIIVG